MEGVAPRLEIGELVEGGAGRREQHDRRLAVRAGIGGSGAHRALHVAGNLVIDAPVKRRGEVLRRLADQVGARDLRKIFGQRFDAA